MGIRKGEPTAAMAFLKSECKGGDSDAAAWVEVESSLCAWWASADEGTKEAHTQIAATNKHLHGAIKRAQRFIVDEQLESWVAEQNVSKGINPVPALTMRQAAVVKRRTGVAIPRTRKGARKWMQRWRLRRGIRLRKFPAIEPLDEKDLHGKASAQKGTTNQTALSYFSVLGM